MEALRIEILCDRTDDDTVNEEIAEKSSYGIPYNSIDEDALMNNLKEHLKELGFRDVVVKIS